MNANTNKPSQIVKPTSHRPSISGGVLSIMSLIIAAIGSALAHAHYHATQPVNTVSEKAGNAVAAGTTRTLAALLSVPIMVLALLLAGIALLLTLMRLGKVKATGLLFSVIWIALSVWAVKLVISGFSAISASGH